MSRKFILSLFLVVFVMFVTAMASAAVVLYEEGTKVGTVEKVNVVGSSLTATVAGNTGTVTATATPTITGGTIDGATIGATTASTGKFTTLEVTTGLNWTDASMFQQTYSGINWTDKHHVCFNDAGVMSSDADGTCP